jgi:hypothetical protein
MRRASVVDEHRSHNIVDDLQNAIRLVYEVITYKTAEATHICKSCGGPVIRGKRSLLKQIFCKPVFWCMNCVKIVD